MVYALDKAGYRVDGIDYASKVVNAVNKSRPRLHVYEGDIYRLPVCDNYYDGYWSLGVIEHYPGGYGEIALEIKRVLRVGGYLFLTFPVFNGFRQLLAKYNKFSILSSDPSELPDFYQFALNRIQVCVDFEFMGFELLEHHGCFSLDGLAEDVILFKKIKDFFIWLYPRSYAVVNMLMDIILGNYAGHSCCLVFRKIR